MVRVTVTVVRAVVSVMVVTVATVRAVVTVQVVMEWEGEGVLALEMGVVMALVMAAMALVGLDLVEEGVTVQSPSMSELN